MKEFYSEVAERKLIASGARHRKTHGKNGKCHMPTDDMTPSQIIDMSGPVKIYQLGKPMDWAAFKSMPEDLQKRYIKNLYSRFGVTNRRLALMFGVDHTTVDKKTAALGIKKKKKEWNDSSTKSFMGRIRGETMKNARVPLETEEQQALFKWVGYQEKQYPELALLYHISNEGRRNPNRAKAEGIKAGVPDLCLPVPRGKNHGAYIEMKRKKGSVITPEQISWMERLKSQGYAVSCCYGWEQAAKFLLEYLRQS